MMYKFWLWNLTILLKLYSGTFPKFIGNKILIGLFQIVVMVGRILGRKNASNSFKFQGHFMMPRTFALHKVTKSCKTFVCVLQRSLIQLLGGKLYEPPMKGPDVNLPDFEFKISLMNEADNNPDIPTGPWIGIRGHNSDK